jgi:hypothetical protein
MSWQSLLTPEALKAQTSHRDSVVLFNDKSPLKRQLESYQKKPSDLESTPSTARCPLVLSGQAGVTTLKLGPPTCQDSLPGSTHTCKRPVD